MECKKKIARLSDLLCIVQLSCLCLFVACFVNDLLPVLLKIDYSLSL